MTDRILKNKATGDIVLARVRWCASTWCHFKGLQLVKSLSEDEGLLFVRHSESIAVTSIHMFFMRFDIGVVWLDRNGKVVDKRYAKTWRPAYASKVKAQYYLEANPSILDKVQIGDMLTFDEVVT